MADDVLKIWHNLKLTDEEVEEVIEDVPESEAADDTPKPWLVGKLLTDKPFNRQGFMNTMKSIWRLVKEVTIVEMEENLFLFKFQTDSDRDRVIDGCPWKFDNFLLVFAGYDGRLRPDQYVFTKSPFWVRVYDLPLGMRSEAMAKIIGSRIGDLIEIDETLNDGGLGVFLRIRVSIDVTKPLRRVIAVKGGDGNTQRRVTYERLPLLCPICGLLGHDEFDCMVPDATKIRESKAYQYGSWLCASPLKRKRGLVGSAAFRQLEKSMGLGKKGAGTSSGNTVTNRALFLPTKPAKMTGRNDSQMQAKRKEPTHDVINLQSRETRGPPIKPLIKEMVDDNLATLLDKERERLVEKLSVKYVEETQGIQNCGQGTRAKIMGEKKEGTASKACGSVGHQTLGQEVLDPILGQEKLGIKEGGIITEAMEACATQVNAGSPKNGEPRHGFFNFQANKPVATLEASSLSRESGSQSSFSRRKKLMRKRMSHGDQSKTTSRGVSLGKRFEQDGDEKMEEVIDDGGKKLKKCNTSLSFDDLMAEAGQQPRQTP